MHSLTIALVVIMAMAVGVLYVEGKNVTDDECTKIKSSVEMCLAPKWGKSDGDVTVQKCCQAKNKACVSKDLRAVGCDYDEFSLTDECKEVNDTSKMCKAILNTPSEACKDEKYLKCFNASTHLMSGQWLIIVSIVAVIAIQFLN